MFTKADYCEYFSQIGSLERSMIYELQELLSEVKEPWLRADLSSVLTDEFRHYGYVMEIFDSVLIKEEDERRRFRREHALGKVRMKVQGEETEVEGYCVNISDSGMCVEFEKEIDFSRQFLAEVEFFDGRDRRFFNGRFVWNVKIAPHLCMGKMRYQAGLRFENG